MLSVCYCILKKQQYYALPATDIAMRKAKPRSIPLITHMPPSPTPGKFSTLLRKLLKIFSTLHVPKASFLRLAHCLLSVVSV